MKATNKFEVGDEVRVLRKAKNHETFAGVKWNNTWVDSMDDAIGKTFIINAIDSSDAGILLGTTGKYFPAGVLEKVTDAISIEDLKNRFSKGTAVKILRKASFEETSPEGEVWNNRWADPMDEFIGKVGKVATSNFDEYTRTRGVSVTLNGNTFRFPHWILEPTVFERKADAMDLLHMKTDYTNEKLSRDEVHNIFTPGTRVTVLRKIKHGDRSNQGVAWENSWVNSMDDFVGNECLVQTAKSANDTDVCLNISNRLSDVQKFFPYWILATLKDAEDIKDEIDITPAVSNESSTVSDSTSYVIGDLVKILKTSTEFLEKYIDSTGIITNINSSYVQVNFSTTVDSNDMTSWAFPFEFIEKLNSKIEKVTTSDVEIMKTGDLVRVVRKPNPGESWSGHKWHTDMDLTVGLIGKIRSAYDSESVTVAFSNSYYTDFWTYSCSLLEVVNDLKISDFNVGDTVLVTHKVDCDSGDNFQGITSSFSWTERMDRTIGQQGKIDFINIDRNAIGVLIEGVTNIYPFWALRKIEKASTVITVTEPFSIGNIVLVKGNMLSGKTTPWLGWHKSMDSTIGCFGVILREFNEMDNVVAIETTEGKITWNYTKDLLEDVTDLNFEHFQVGDIVRITHKCNEKAIFKGKKWDGVWDYEMDSTVDKSGYISAVSREYTDSYVVVIEGEEWHYPFWALKKIKSSAVHEEELENQLDSIPVGSKAIVTNLASVLRKTDVEISGVVSADFLGKTFQVLDVDYGDYSVLLDTPDRDYWFNIEWVQSADEPEIPAEKEKLTSSTILDKLSTFELGETVVVSNLDNFVRKSNDPKNPDFNTAFREESLGKTFKIIRKDVSDATVKLESVGWFAVEWIDKFEQDIIPKQPKLENKLAPGDFVKIIRKAAPNESFQGEVWQNIWNDAGMNPMIGNIYPIRNQHKDGIQFGISGYLFPWWVLEKVVHVKDDSSIQSERTIAADIIPGKTLVRIQGKYGLVKEFDSKVLVRVDNRPERSSLITIEDRKHLDIITDPEVLKRYQIYLTGTEVEFSLRDDLWRKGTVISADFSPAVPICIKKTDSNLTFWVEEDQVRLIQEDNSFDDILEELFTGDALKPKPEFDTTFDLIDSFLVTDLTAAKDTPVPIDQIANEFIIDRPIKRRRRL